MNAAGELKAKCADFLAGRYGKLTTDEIEEFREAMADPDGTKWDREHAGMPVHIDPLDLNGFLFVEFPAEISHEESLEILKRIVGARPITAGRLWWIARHKLIDKEMKHER